MKILGLIGYPLDHSFSQGWFTSKFEKEGITDCIYNNFPLKDMSELGRLIKKTPELCGFNVTAPYKVEVMEYLDEVDNTAKEIGAVNCVVRNDGKWTGYNVDWQGFAESLKSFLGNGIPEHALILGSGGAAKAAAYALRQMSVDYKIVSRNAGQGHIAYSDLDTTTMKTYKLIVNATPLGTYPAAEKYPDIPYELLSDRHILYDMVYNPAVTEFMRKGTHANARTINGQAMLEKQAELSWELFRLSN